MILLQISNLRMLHDIIPTKVRMFKTIVSGCLDPQREKRDKKKKKK